MIEQIEARNAAAWHRLRGKDVTASVAGALFGVHEFITPFKLWQLKAGRLEADPEESPAMKRGRLLEPVAIALLREQRPHWRVAHNSGSATRYYRDPEARIGATPDALVEFDDEKAVVQIKSVEATAFRRKWIKDDGIIEPPLWIAVQASVEAYLTGSSRAFVAALVVGHGIDLHVVEVPLIAGLIDRIKELSVAFWKSVETGEEPAPDYRLDGETLDRLYSRNEGGEVDLTRDARIELLVMARNVASARKRDAESELDQIDAEVKAKMKGAAVAHLAGGRKIYQPTRRRTNADGSAVSFRILQFPKSE